VDRAVSRYHDPNQRYRLPVAALRLRSAARSRALSLVLLAIAVPALYAFRAVGAWHWAYIIAAITAPYLNVFVGVIQAFLKLPSLHVLAPTRSEPPFLVTQLIVLVIFITLGVLAVRRFRPLLGAQA
jgi:hypothetical protein